MKEFQILILTLMIIVMFGRFFLSSKLFSSRIVTNFIIPGILLFLWLYLMVYQSYQVEKVVTILTDSYSRSQLRTYPSDEIIAGQKVIGSFKASDNYLGIVGFRFWNFYRLNDDFMVFRIRELGTSNWYYQNKYKSDQFEANGYFTFGFPVINDSKDRNFEFEIESTIGIPGNAIGVSKIDPVFIAKYKYPRNVVTQDTSSASKFVIKKLFNLFRSSEYTAQSFIFLLPFLLYVIFIARIKNNIIFKLANLVSINLGKSVILGQSANTKFEKILVSNKKKLSVSLSYVGLIIDAVFIKNSDISLLILIAAFAYIYISYRINHHWLILTAIFCLIFSAVYYYFGPVFSSERFSAWAWIFLFMWIMIQVKNLKKQTLQ